MRMKKLAGGVIALCVLVPAWTALPSASDFAAGAV